MNTTALLGPDSKKLDGKPGMPSDCPLCGSDQFQLRRMGTEGSFVTQVCPVCGLMCQVVVGPESPSLEALNLEWAAVFTHD